MAARIKAEEQALIEGLKAVPRAERHRLREIPEEEAYDQWRLRLAAEAIGKCGRAGGGTLAANFGKKWEKRRTGAGTLGPSGK